MVTFRMLLLLCGLFHKSSLDLAFAYPNGAGDCPEGKAAVGGPHLSASKITTGLLSKGKYSMIVGGIGVTNKKTVHPAGLKFNIRVKGPSFKGILIRVSGATSSQVTPGPGLKVASICKDVGGVTHSSNSTKKEAYATVTLSKPAYLHVDITIVVKNDQSGSEYYYSSFNIDARGVKVGQNICVEGYVMDVKTITSGVLCDKPKLKALTNPDKYTVHCLVDIPANIDSGYEILTDPAPGKSRYTRGWRLQRTDWVVNSARQIGICDTCRGMVVEKGFQIAVNASVLALATDTSPPLILILYMEDIYSSKNKLCSG